METKVEEQPTAIDTAKLALAVLVVAGSLVAYYYYGDTSVLLRSIGVLVALGLGAWIVLQSVQGRALWKFMQSARIELRKVVWPTREETIQTTFAVLLLAVIGGVFFWLLDLVLLWASGKLTGRG